ncbi:MAG: ubiquinone/menaquinone biosynthesis methyltransferase [Caldilineales bacterium]|nr:ubiquinone/menaquinone biosynthesis methyltransferase [Caldilineales bacterium]
MTDLPSPEEKPRYVRSMFAGTARRYDLMNRLMTLGQDQSWRRLVVKACHLPPGGLLLDVATGTGDIALEALRMQPDVHVIGADFTMEMMRVGQAKEGAEKLPFVGADAMRLPFADNTFDATCSGFLMRNVSDIVATFAEQMRVVRAGGRVVCLEITRPDTPVWSDVFGFYFHQFVPRVTALLSSNKNAYKYLPASTVAFPRPPVLKALMEEVGLRDVSYRTMMAGTIALHVGTV